ncbi:hypothetical protein J4Q44_G00268600 [Coregonus suidteri]|uniref:Uncharacterized protein n=1 Tax=Coregonus suidteri TaxID=861788 RepID=A0AAN8L682_9TELE
MLLHWLQMGLFTSVQHAPDTFQGSDWRFGYMDFAPPAEDTAAEESPTEEPPSLSHFKLLLRSMCRELHLILRQYVQMIQQLRIEQLRIQQQRIQQQRSHQPRSLRFPSFLQSLLDYCREVNEAPPAEEPPAEAPPQKDQATPPPPLDVWSSASPWSLLDYCREVNEAPPAEEPPAEELLQKDQATPKRHPSPLDVWSSVIPWDQDHNKDQDQDQGSGWRTHGPHGAPRAVAALLLLGCQ